MLFGGFDELVSVPHFPQYDSSHISTADSAPDREAKSTFQNYVNHSMSETSKPNLLSSSLHSINPENELQQCHNNIGNVRPITQTKVSLSSEIQVMFWNIQGIGSKLELSSIQKLLAKYDIIFFLETMKLDNFDPSLPNFQFFHCQRECQHPHARRPSGGIGVLINNRIKSIVKIEKLN